MFTKRILGMFLLASFLFCSASVAFADGDGFIDTTLPVFTGNYDIVVANLGSLNSRGKTTSLVKLPSDADIIAAYAYGSGYSDLTRDQLGDIEIDFRNKTDQNSVTAYATLVGYEEVDGLNYFTYRADVTQVVSAGTKTYRMNGFTLPNMPTSAAGFHGVALVIVYAQENLPQADIHIADGVDFFSAAKDMGATDVTVFDIPALGFNQAASVKICAAQNSKTTGDATTLANGIWYATGDGAEPTALIDAAGAVAFDNSSQTDPAIDTDPLYAVSTYGLPEKWSTVEMTMPISDSDTWAALQLESQSDKEGATPYEGVWIMAAVRVVLEEVGCGTIGDVVFYDRNGDGIQSLNTEPDQYGRTNERGIPGVTVRLYQDNGDGVFNTAHDAKIDTMLTNEFGYYEFRYLELGTYFVEIDHERLDPQYIYFTNISNPTDAIVLSECTPVLDIDFGLAISNLPSGGAGSRRGGGGSNTGGFDFGNFDFGSFGDDTGSGFNFGGGGFMGGFGQTMPVELSDFEILESDTQVKVAYLAIDSEESNFQVYRSIDRYDGYEAILVTMEKTAVEDRLVFTDEDVDAGSHYYYHIVEIDERGDRLMHGPVGVQVSGLPSAYSLSDVYPNPFNPSTKISYQLPEAGQVTLEIYNMMGQKVKSLVSVSQSAGSHVVNWDGTNDLGHTVSAGAYMVRLSAGDFEATRTITFLK